MAASGKPGRIEPGYATVTEPKAPEMVVVDGIRYRPEDVPTKTRKVVVEDEPVAETKVRTPAPARPRK